MNKEEAIKIVDRITDLVGAIIDSRSNSESVDSLEEVIYQQDELVNLILLATTKEDAGE